MAKTNGPLTLSARELIEAVDSAGDFADPELRALANKLRRNIHEVTLTTCQSDALEKAIKANKEIQKQSDSTAP